MLKTNKQSIKSALQNSYHVYLNQQHTEGEGIAKLFQTVMNIVWVEVMIPKTSHVKKQKQKGSEVEKNKEEVDQQTLF